MCLAQPRCLLGISGPDVGEHLQNRVEFNRALHACVVTRLYVISLQRQRNFENQLPVKYKMADGPTFSTFKSL